LRMHERAPWESLNVYNRDIDFSIPIERVGGL
jgi:hypothetical protein